MQRNYWLLILAVAGAAIVTTSCTGGALGPGGGGGGGTPPPTPGPTPPPPAIYVANTNAEILAFNVGSSGNVAPARTISGSNTQMNGTLWGITTDLSGQVYVSTFQSTPFDPIDVFAPGANGNVAPVRTITSLNFSEHAAGLTVASTGELFLGVGNAITVMSATANGSSTPLRSIVGSSTQLNDPWVIAFDSSGNIYAANSDRTDSLAPSFITVFAAGASGNTAPIRVISGSSTGLDVPDGIALDSSGNTYIANFGNGSVTVYAAGASGNTAPIRNISGSSTGLAHPTGLALDGSGNIYVSEASSNSVLVFANAANGNVAPTSTISGSNTMISSPAAIAIGP